MNNIVLRGLMCTRCGNIVKCVDVKNTFMFSNQDKLFVLLLVVLTM